MLDFKCARRWLYQNRISGEKLFFGHRVPSSMNYPTGIGIQSHFSFIHIIKIIGCVVFRKDFIRELWKCFWFWRGRSSFWSPVYDGICAARLSGGCGLCFFWSLFVLAWTSCRGSPSWLRAEAVHPLAMNQHSQRSDGQIFSKEIAAGHTRESNDFFHFFSLESRLRLVGIFVYVAVSTRRLAYSLVCLYQLRRALGWLGFYIFYHQCSKCSPRTPGVAQKPICVGIEDDYDSDSCWMCVMFFHGFIFSWFWWSFAPLTCHGVLSSLFVTCEVLISSVSLLLAWILAYANVSYSNLLSGTILDVHRLRIKGCFLSIVKNSGCSKSGHVGPTLL